MPGPGRKVEREYTVEERAAIAATAAARGESEREVLALLGATTYDIYLNQDAYWANVPKRVWEYTIGGYQVLKKWLSYRERKLLGRPLKPEEVEYVQEVVRRLAALRLLEPALDANYVAVKADVYPWPG